MTGFVLTGANFWSEDAPFVWTFKLRRWNEWATSV